MRRKKPKENTSEIKTQNCKMPQEQLGNKKREQIVFAFGIGMPKAATKTTTTTGNNNGNGRAKIAREKREGGREGGATVAVAGIIIKSTNRF